MERNRALALTAREVLLSALDLEPPCPDSMIGSLVSLPLPEESGKPSKTAPHIDALQDVLWDDHRIEVQIMLRAAPPKRVMRVSAQLYNSAEQYARLVEIVRRAI